MYLKFTDCVWLGKGMHFVKFYFLLLFFKTNDMENKSVSTLSQWLFYCQCKSLQRNTDCDETKHLKQGIFVLFIVHLCKAQQFKNFVSQAQD